MLEGRGLQAEVNAIRYDRYVRDTDRKTEESDLVVQVKYDLDVEGWEGIDHAEIKVVLDDEGIDIAVFQGEPSDVGEISPGKEVVNQKKKRVYDILLDAIADDMVTRVKTGD